MGMNRAYRRAISASGLFAAPMRRMSMAVVGRVVGSDSGLVAALPDDMTLAPGTVVSVGDALGVVLWHRSLLYLIAMLGMPVPDLHAHGCVCMRVHADDVAPATGATIRAPFAPSSRHRLVMRPHELLGSSVVGLASWADTAEAGRSSHRSDGRWDVLRPTATQVRPTRTHSRRNGLALQPRWIATCTRAHAMYAQVERGPITRAMLTGIAAIDTLTPVRAHACVYMRVPCRAMPCRAGY